MKKMRTTRRSTRCLAVGAVAALALTASAAGTAFAAQPAQEVPTYDCDEGIEVTGLVSAFDCDASAGAPTLGTINGPFVINTPSDSWTCASGLAVVPLTVLGFDCE